MSSLSTEMAATRLPWSRPYLFSAGVDTAFFFAPILVGMLLLASACNVRAGESSVLLVLLFNAFGLGPFHHSATWFFYLDKKHRDYFSSGKVQILDYFVYPAAIILLTYATVVVLPALAYLFAMAWAVQHLVQQNIGILLLYQKTKGEEATAPRELVVKSLWMPCLFTIAVYLYRIAFEKVADNTTLLLSGFTVMKITQGAASIALGALGIYALWTMYSYIASLYKQVQNGHPLNVLALAFWLLSIVSFSPFFFFKNSFALAFLIPLVMHWFQYVGLNYMLVKNKYQGERLANLPLPRPVLLFVSLGALLTLAMMGSAVALVHLHIPTGSVAFNLLTGIGLGMANAHYFLDSRIWKFRDRHQQQEVLPYLLTQRSAHQQ